MCNCTKKVNCLRTLLTVSIRARIWHVFFIPRIIIDTEKKSRSINTKITNYRYLYIVNVCTGDTAINVTVPLRVRCIDSSQMEIIHSIWYNYFSLRLWHSSDYYCCFWMAFLVANDKRFSSNDYGSKQIDIHCICKSMRKNQMNEWQFLALIEQ